MKICLIIFITKEIADPNSGNRMKYVLKYLSDYKKESILAPLFKMLEAAFELLVPLVVSGIIDVGIAGGDRSYVVRMSGLMIVLAIIGLASALCAQFFSAKAAILAASKMRQDLFYHIGDFSENRLGQVGTDSLVTRLTSDVNQVQNGINMFLRLFLRSPFIVLGAAICAFMVDVQGALVFAVAIPLMALCVWIVMKANLPRYHRIQQMLERLLGRVSENLTGVRVIRAFGREDAEKESFDGQSDKLYGAQLGAGRIAAVSAPVTYLIVNLSVVVILMTGGYRVNAGALSTGEVVALLNYMSQILVELIKLANLILLLTRALTSAARLQDIMAMEPDERAYEAQSDLSGVRSASVDNSRQADDIILEAHDLSFTYPGSAESALDGISFEVKAGETLGIIGGTGSGKSTLTKLITHRYDISGGSLKILGRDSSSYTDEEMPRICGVVPQKAQLFAGTLSDNLRAAGPDASEDEMWEALRVAQAYDFVKEKGQGLELHVLREGKNFSGGQKQRLTIARALLTKAPIIILDDSASALDMLTEKNLREALGELEWKPSLVIVSQRASSVLSAEHILVLEGGEVAGYGTAKELLESSNVFREIYDTQFGDLQGEEVVA